jgi:hypothetical protein
MSIPSVINGPGSYFIWESGIMLRLVDDNEAKRKELEKVLDERLKKERIGYCEGGETSLVGPPISTINLYVRTDKLGHFHRIYQDILITEPRLRSCRVFLGSCGETSKRKALELYGVLN